MNGHVGFYGALATASGALFGVGAGIVWSRLIALTERAGRLRVEYGDLLNQQADPGASHLQLRWAQRLRRDELADTHILAGSVRRAALLPLVAAGLLVVGSVLPLAAFVEDATWYRALLLVLFVGALTLWTFLLLQMSADLAAVTKAAHRERADEQSQAKAEGKAYLVSGVETQLGDPEIVDRLAKLFPDLASTRRRRRSIRRWKRRLGKFRRPVA